MAQIRNTTDGTQTIPFLGIDIPSGATATVRAALAAELAGRPGWEIPAPTKTTKTTKADEAATTDTPEA